MKQGQQIVLIMTTSAICIAEHIVLTLESLGTFGSFSPKPNHLKCHLSEELRFVFLRAHFVLDQ